jgi:hypothetical protein
MNKYKVTIAGVGETEVQGTYASVAVPRAMWSLMQNLKEPKTLSLTVEQIGTVKRIRKPKCERKPYVATVGDIVCDEDDIQCRVVEVGEDDGSGDRPCKVIPLAAYPSARALGCREPSAHELPTAASVAGPVRRNCDTIYTTVVGRCRTTGLRISNCSACPVTRSQMLPAYVYGETGT